jgi:hypothetical protein
MAPTTWGGENSHLLIKNKEQLIELLSDFSKVNFKASQEFKVFASYYSKHGQKYQFVNFTDNKVKYYKYSVFIEDLELDKPRFKFVRQRK